MWEENIIQSVTVLIKKRRCKRGRGTESSLKTSLLSEKGGNEKGRNVAVMLGFEVPPRSTVFQHGVPSVLRHPHRPSQDGPEGLSCIPCFLLCFFFFFFLISLVVVAAGDGEFGDDDERVLWIFLAVPDVVQRGGGGRRDGSRVVLPRGILEGVCGVERLRSRRANRAAWWRLRHAVLLSVTVCYADLHLQKVSPFFLSFSHEYQNQRL